MNPFHSRIAAAAILSGAVTQVSAQSPVVEEVVVTAQKRAESAQDIPLSVTALSGDALAELGIADSIQLSRQTPGLNVGTPVGEGNNPAFTLRGVGLNDFNDNNEGPIAIYTDEIYNAALAGLTFQLFDTERVEVLRGPQGTLYGRNATGGLIHFISRKPSSTLEGYGTLQYGRYDEMKAEGAVSGPLNDGIRARLAGAYHQHDGYVENRIGPDGNEADSVAVRGMLETDIGESGSLLLRGTYAHSDVASPRFQHQGTGSPFGPDVDIWNYRDSDGDVFAGEYDDRGRLDIRNTGASATANWSFGAADLTWITAYSEVEKSYEEDTDLSGVDGIDPSFAADIAQFTQEFRLSGKTDSLQWIAGLYYFDTNVRGKLTNDVNWRGDYANILDVEVFDGGLTAANGPIPNDATLVDALSYDVNYTQDTQSVAAFGQLDINLSERVVLGAGLRYTTEERTLEYVNAMRTDGSLLNTFFRDLVGLTEYFDFRSGVAGVGGLNRIESDNLSGKVSLSFEATEDALLYASVSRGFKSGGFNAGFIDQTDGLTPSDIPYDEELLTAYEIGAKTDLLGRTLRINSAVFYYDYEDFQALTFQGLSQFITNGSATMRGGEVEVSWHPTTQLELQLGGSYLDAAVDGVQNRNAGVTLNDVEPVLAPRVSASGHVRYEWPLGAGALSALVSFSHRGEHYFDITNSDVSRESAYTLYGARLAYASDQRKWEVAAFVDNLTDEEYRVYSFDFSAVGGFNQQMYGPPRWWGVSLTTRF